MCNSAERPEFPAVPLDINFSQTAPFLSQKLTVMIFHLWRTLTFHLPRGCNVQPLCRLPSGFWFTKVDADFISPENMRLEALSSCMAPVQNLNLVMAKIFGNCPYWWTKWDILHPLIRRRRHIALHQVGRCCQRVQRRAFRGFSSSVSPVTASLIRLTVEQNSSQQFLPHALPANVRE